MNAARHEATSEEIMALLDGELPVERASAVARHVEECATCKEIQQPIHSTSHALAAWVVPAQGENPQFENRLFDIARHIRSQEQAKGVRKFAPFFRRHWLLTAASSAVAAGFVLTLSPGSHHSQSNLSYDKAITEVGQGSGFGMGPVEGQSATNQQSKIFTDRLPSTRPQVSRDSNGLLQRLVASPPDSFSAEGTLGAKLGQSGRDHRGSVESGPMVARTVSLSIIAKDFTGSRAALNGILSRHHGYAATLAVNTEQDAAQSLQASLRVPAAELDAVLAELKSLGRVRNEQQNGEEVAQQHADLVAHLKNSRETEIRLQDILRNRTGKISDVLAVEQEIARVRGEIEQMEAEQTNLEHRVNYATVDLILAEEYKAQLGAPAASISTRFHNAGVSGLGDALDMLVGVALFFVEVGPSLVIWLVVLLPVVWFFWRRWRRSYRLATSGLL